MRCVGSTIGNIVVLTVTLLVAVLVLQPRQGPVELLQVRARVPGGVADSLGDDHLVREADVGDVAGQEARDVSREVLSSPGDAVVDSGDAADDQEVDDDAAKDDFEVSGGAPSVASSEAPGGSTGEATTLPSQVSEDPELEQGRIVTQENAGESLQTQTIDAESDSVDIISAARKESLAIATKDYCPHLFEPPPDDVLFTLPGLDFKKAELKREFRAKPRYLTFDGTCATVSRKCKTLELTPDPTEGLTTGIFGNKIANSTQVGFKHCFKEVRGLRPEYVHAWCDDEENIVYVPQKRTVNVKRNPDKLNILLVQLDGISKRQYDRALKKSEAMLDSLEHAEVFKFSKLHALGVSSLVNKFPLYGGHQITPKIQKDHDSPSRDDWIWNKANTDGYMSLYASNLCGKYDRTTKNRTLLETGGWKGANDQFMNGSILSWIKNVSTIDHLFPPKLWCHQAPWPPKKHSSRSSACAGEGHAFMMKSQGVLQKVCVAQRHNWEYIRDFFDGTWKLYDGIPKFGSFTAWENHISQQYGSYYSDPKAASWISDWYGSEDGLGKNTMLILNSDHGLHMGKWYIDSRGKAENQWPFMRIVVPKWWLAKNPTAHGALIRAQNAVVTPYDVHQTIKHIMSWPKPPSENRQKAGISLLRPDLNPTRDCIALGMGMNDNCNCHQVTALQPSSKMWDSLAQFAYNAVVSLIPQPKVSCRLWPLSSYTVDTVSASNTTFLWHTRPKLVVTTYIMRTTFGSGDEAQVFETTVQGSTDDDKLALIKPPLQLTEWMPRISDPCKEAVEATGALQYCSCLI